MDLDRHTHRQAYGQRQVYWIDRQTDRQTDRRQGRYTLAGRPTVAQTRVYRHTAGRQTSTDRPTETGKQTGRQT